jgi:hypothetical protein
LVVDDLPDNYFLLQPVLYQVRQINYG